MQQGDLVTRRSYGGDIIFKIQGILQQQAILRGIDYRLLADAPLNDLLAAPQLDPYQYAGGARPPWMESVRRTAMHQRLSLTPVQTEGKTASAEKPAPVFFELPGKVLHLDGDPA